jgi:hypothetical protein
MPARPTLLKEEFALKPNAEWASNPIKLTAGWQVELDAIGSTRFYVALVTADFYDTHDHAPGGPFPFPFQSDRSTFLKTYTIENTAYYRVVVRNSMFNEPGSIVVRLSLIG